MEILLQRTSLLLAILALAIALPLLCWRIYDQVLESINMMNIKGHAMATLTKFV